MSVIIGRALPDVRDGLKPAHRRVLYAMRQMGLASNRPYRKCAKIVGEVIGNYHPHGDAPAYDTLVRLAQDFNMRYLLVDGQGNFGSVDGDPPAAYRYTEARLENARRSDDGATSTRRPSTSSRTSTRRPKSRPSCRRRSRTCSSTARPGIAVGMATNIPPHNMREVIDGVIARRSSSARRQPRQEARLRAVLQAIPGPDFPTGGTIVGREGIFSAYTTGRGSITVRAKADDRGDRRRATSVSIVITEIPYQVNKKRAAREHRRPGPRQDDRGHLGPARRVGSRRHADRHRAEARRAARGRS